MNEACDNSLVQGLPGVLSTNNGSNIIKPWALAHGFMILEPLFINRNTIIIITKVLLAQACASSSRSSCHWRCAYHHLLDVRLCLACTQGGGACVHRGYGYVPCKRLRFEKHAGCCWSTHVFGRRRRSPSVILAQPLALSENILARRCAMRGLFGLHWSNGACFCLSNGP